MIGERGYNISKIFFYHASVCSFRRFSRPRHYSKKSVFWPNFPTSTTHESRLWRCALSSAIRICLSHTWIFSGIRPPPGRSFRVCSYDKSCIIPSLKILKRICLPTTRAWKLYILFLILTKSHWRRLSRYLPFLKLSRLNIVQKFFNTLKTLAKYKILKLISEV